MTFTEGILTFMLVAAVLAFGARRGRAFPVWVTTGVMLLHLYIVDRTFALIGPWSELLQ